MLNAIASQDCAASTPESSPAYGRTKHRVARKFIANILNCLRVAVRGHQSKTLCAQIILIVVEVQVHSKRYITQTTGPRQNTRTRGHCHLHKKMKREMKIQNAGKVRQNTITTPPQVESKLQYQRKYRKDEFLRLTELRMD